MNTINKQCTCCKETKPLTSFPKRSNGQKNGKSAHRSQCNTCVARKFRASEKGRESSRKRSKKAQQLYREQVYDLKIRLMKAIGQTSCKHCAFNNPLALTFHHRNPEEKEFILAKGFSRRYCYEKLLPEAMKCDILCHNCHHILHGEERLAARESLIQENRVSSQK